MHRYLGYNGKRKTAEEGEGLTDDASLILQRTSGLRKEAA